MAPEGPTDSAAHVPASDGAWKASGEVEAQAQPAAFDATTSTRTSYPASPLPSVYVEEVAPEMATQAWLVPESRCHW